MGYSLSMLALKTTHPESALAQLNIEKSGKYCDYATKPLTGYSLPEGWYLIVATTSNARFLKPQQLTLLSTYVPLIACSIEEHVMYSSAEYWEGGDRVWRVEHHGEDGPIHLNTSGMLPVDFTDMSNAIIEQQNAEGGAAAGVDYYFDIPLNAAKAIIGFKHDEDVSGIDYAHFELLHQSSKNPGKPWWRFWG